MDCNPRIPNPGNIFNPEILGFSIPQSRISGFKNAQNYLVTITQNYQSQFITIVVLLQNIIYNSIHDRYSA